MIWETLEVDFFSSFFSLACPSSYFVGCNIAHPECPRVVDTFRDETSRDSQIDEKKKLRSVDFLFVGFSSSSIQVIR